MFWHRRASVFLLCLNMGHAPKKEQWEAPLLFVEFLKYSPKEQGTSGELLEIGLPINVLSFSDAFLRDWDQNLVRTSKIFWNENSYVQWRDNLRLKKY